MTNIPSIPARAWNGIMRRLNRARPLRITLETNRVRRHAWNVRTRWDAEREQWMIQVHAGTVNARDVQVEIPATDTVPARLTDLSREEWLPVRQSTWRALGTDALTAAEAVPEFFLQRGVNPPPDPEEEEDQFAITEDGATVVESASGLNGASLDDPTAAIGSGGQARVRDPRLLRAIDLVLIQPRPRLDVQWLTGGPLQSQQLQVSLNLLEPSDREPKLEIRSRFVELATPSTADFLLGGVTGLAGVEGGLNAAGGTADPGRDEKRIATVYLLSPPGEVAKPDSPGRQWTPFVKHELFWNLNHATQSARSPEEGTVFSAPIALGAGSASNVIAGLAASAQDPANQIAQLVAGSQVEGRFWGV